MTQAQAQPSSVELTGVPETMLWTLHNRASEAARADGIIRDPEALRIYRSIPYDYERSFGKANASHAERSRVFDELLRPWMAAHPAAQVVELGCGLETQYARIDDGKVRWLCVDVPEAIDVRERFLTASERCRHLRCSALDLRWIDEVEDDGPVFVTAQGLLMYFEVSEVRRLLVAIVERLTTVDIAFDVIPPWFSRRTMSGFDITPHYRAPKMPWGERRDRVPALLHSWSPQIRSVEHVKFNPMRGLQGRVFSLMSRIPVIRNHAPCVVRVRARKHGVR